MAALVFLVDTLLSLCLLAVLLRLLLQWSRADFRAPLVRSLVQITNPVVLPLRRVLPAIGRLDTASAVAVLVFAAADAAAPALLSGIGLPPLVMWGWLTLAAIVRMVLRTYLFTVFLYVLLSFLTPASYSPVNAVLAPLAESLLRPVRRLIPPLAGLDLSPLWVLIAIQAALIGLTSLTGV
ncbi:MAG TPA: YggT family protein [Steroidobacteraceae bacterium]